jgi:hypothetical protein
LILDGRPRPSTETAIAWAICAAAILILWTLARATSLPAGVLLAGLVCTAGLVQQVRLASAGTPQDPRWQAMVRMTEWIKRNLAATDALVVQDGLDCVVARLTPNSSFYFPDGMSGAEEQSIVRDNRVRYVIRIKFTGANEDETKIALLREQDAQLLRSVYDGPDFEVFAVSQRY